MDVPLENMLTESRFPARREFLSSMMSLSTSTPICPRSKPTNTHFRNDDHFTDSATSHKTSPTGGAVLDHDSGYVDSMSNTTFLSDHDGSGGRLSAEMMNVDTPVSRNGHSPSELHFYSPITQCSSDCTAKYSTQSLKTSRLFDIPEHEFCSGFKEMSVCSFDLDRESREKCNADVSLFNSSVKSIGSISPKAKNANGDSSYGLSTNNYYMCNSNTKSHSPYTSSTKTGDHQCNSESNIESSEFSTNLRIKNTDSPYTLSTKNIDSLYTSSTGNTESPFNLNTKQYDSPHSSNTNISISTHNTCTKGINSPYYTTTSIFPSSSIAKSIDSPYCTTTGIFPGNSKTKSIDSPYCTTTSISINSPYSTDVTSKNGNCGSCSKSESIANSPYISSDCEKVKTWSENSPTDRERFDRILRHFSPREPDRLIGRKMGLDHVDFLVELHSRSIDTSLILSYLESADLCRVCRVSQQWKQICEGTPSSYRRMRAFVKQNRAPFTGKENCGRRLKDRQHHGLTRPTTTLGCIQNTELQTKTPSVLASPTKQNTSFFKAAQLLHQDERLCHCPKCHSPSRVVPVEERGGCFKCGYDFCVKCLTEYHQARPCVPVACKKVKTDNVGGKKSKRNLKRL